MRKVLCSKLSLMTSQSSFGEIVAMLQKNAVKRWLLKKVRILFICFHTLYTLIFLIWLKQLRRDVLLLGMVGNVGQGEVLLAKLNTVPVQITFTFIQWINSHVAVRIFLILSKRILKHFSSKGYAEKQCLENGRWYYTNRSGEWTNYKTCSRVEAHLTQERVHVVLYGISVAALTPAIVIFFAYK